MARHRNPEPDTLDDEDDFEDSVDILDGDFERAPDCDHADGLPCGRCTPVFRKVGAFDVPAVLSDLRKLVARGRYIATRHHERRREGELIVSEQRFEFTSADGNGPRLLLIVEE